MNHANSKRLLTGGMLAALAVLFVAAIVIANGLLRSARLDLTANRLYTLTEGTREIVGGIKEPINLYFFFSDKGTQNIPYVRTYAQRVREMLEEIAASAKGKINLKVIDPLPFSEEEDLATNYGLQAVPTGNSGQTIFFGLAGTNSTDGKMLIPFFQPDKEAFLEYDLAKLIHGLTTTAKPVVGVISGLAIGPGYEEQSKQMRQGWAFYQSLQELFEVRQLNAASTQKIDADIKTLLIIQPKQFTDALQYAVEQFVMRGGNLLVFVDPNAELDQSGADPNNPQSALLADKSSDLPKLFKAWGVDYDPSKVLLDAQNALAVQSSSGQNVRHLAIMGFKGEYLDNKDVITSQLGTVNFSTAGVVRLAAGAKLALKPLIQSSGDSMLVAADRVKFLTDPSALFEGFASSKQNYVLAGRLEGKLQTAFPENKAKPEHLDQSKENAHILLVADTDVLSDRLWVQVQNFFGQQIMQAFANNGDFAVNAVDNLTGSSALISVRGRATSARAFTTVEALRREADDRYRVKEQELNKELAETERKLNELQQNKSSENALILSPEQKTELERFQQEKVRIRKELRQVRRQLDASIEALGTKLKLINILLVPFLVIGAAMLFAARRRRQNVAAESPAAA